MITQEHLKELIDYNPETGIAFWKTGPRAGRRVGWSQPGKRNKPYRRTRLTAACNVNGTYAVQFSHLVVFYMTGQWPISEVDHRNGDTLDDRWDNLRESTREQNEANRGARRNNKLGLKGVRQNGSRFSAEIYRKGVHLYLGMFDTPQQAHAAYLAEAAKHDGEFLRAA